MPGEPYIRVAVRMSSMMRSIVDEMFFIGDLLLRLDGA